MTRSAMTLLIAMVALAGGACAASGPSNHGSEAASALVDTDRSCLSGRWQLSADTTTTIVVSAENGCGRRLTCDVHLTFATAAGPDLYLDCPDRDVPVGHSPQLCRWSDQPASKGGSGSMTCR